MLFADASTGARSTSIVSQGRIGAIIAAKPEQRRILLEEAAGITGLHSRRHDAELRLNSTENKIISLEDVRGENGVLIMFICNHCPYVKAVIEDIVIDCKNLEQKGIKSVAICSNDVQNYPEDSFDKMKEFSNSHKFGFPYLTSPITRYGLLSAGLI